MKTLNHTTRLRRQGGGFTLSETLVALAVFMIGFIAIAALFPSAALLQKQTMDDARTKQFSSSVKSIFSALSYNGATLEGRLLSTTFAPIEATDISGRVHRFRQTRNTDPNLQEYGGFSLRDRSSPALEPIIDGDSGARYFFVPLVMDSNREPDIQEWLVFVMILQREGTATYTAGASAANRYDPDWVPKVNNRDATKNTSVYNRIDVTTNAGEFLIGDKVLASNGVSYTVTKPGNGWIEVNSVVIDTDDSPLKSIWFAKPGSGSRSPLRDILVLAGEDAVIAE